MKLRHFTVCSSICIKCNIVILFDIVRRSATVTVTTQSVLMESDIAKGQAERKRKGTEKDDTERKKRDVTSPPAGT